eukprot:6173394-Pleurochrysis_carterae.AAC.1
MFFAACWLILGAFHLCAYFPLLTTPRSACALSGALNGFCAIEICRFVRRSGRCSARWRWPSAWRPSCEATRS